MIQCQWKRKNITPVCTKSLNLSTRLFTLSKVFKRIGFLYYLTINNLKSKKQSGFRPVDFCTNQLLFLIDEVHEVFDDKDCFKTRSVYLDMSKAFDNVWQARRSNFQWNNIEHSFFKKTILKLIHP